MRDVFPIDVIGPALRDLDCAVETLQLTDPVRLYGDRVVVAGAVLALTLVLARIDGIAAAQQQAAE